MRPLFLPDAQLDFMDDASEGVESFRFLKLFSALVVSTCNGPESNGYLRSVVKNSRNDCEVVRTQDLYDATFWPSQRYSLDTLIEIPKFHHSPRVTNKSNLALL